MRRVVLTSLVLVAALGCAGRDQTPFVATPGGPIAGPQPEPVLPTIVPSPALAVAADPNLEGFTGWPLVFDTTPGGYGPLHCTVSLTRAGTVLALLDGTLGPSTCTVTWTGRDPSGLALPPGPVNVDARLLDAGATMRAQSESRVELVRLGIAQVDLVGATGAQAPLLYTTTGGVRGAYAELTTTDVEWKLGPDRSEGAGSVVNELADGSARPLPAIWMDVLSPPLDAAAPDGLEHDTYSLPSAWVAGSQLDARVHLNADVAAGAGMGAPTITEVRVVPPTGLTIAAGADMFAHATVVSAHTTTSPVPAVGRYDVAWRWTFEARNAGGEWAPMPGSITTNLRLYGLVALPTMRYDALPHRAWVDIVDQIAQWVDGSSADPTVVGGRLVEGIYDELGLAYDRASGASAYTWYSGGGSTGFEGGQYEALHFQTRDFGAIINCSDASSILSTFANMIGIDLRYHILRKWGSGGFDLNFIQAIGWPGFTETPFTGGRGAFSYHSVVGPPDTTFFDATLALDGDGVPTALPSTALLAAGMPATDYIRDLSSEWMTVTPRLDEKVRVR